MLETLNQNICYTNCLDRIVRYSLFLDDLFNRYPDYYGQVPDVPDYAEYQPLQHHQYKDVGDDDQRIRFPALTPKQKQFAVNPGVKEFRAPEPDFLQYRLEELDEADPGNIALEEELQSILGGAGADDGPAALADKRGMLGAPRAAPLIEEIYQEEKSDDFLFTCKKEALKLQTYVSLSHF